VATHSLASPGRRVAFVPATAAETVEDTGAAGAAETADTGEQQQECDRGNNDPHPDGGTTHREITYDGSHHSSLLVTVSYIGSSQTLVIGNTGSSPDTLEEPVDLFPGFINVFVDILLSIPTEPASSVYSDGQCGHEQQHRAQLGGQHPEAV